MNFYELRDQKREEYEIKLKEIEQALENRTERAYELFQKAQLNLYCAEIDFLYSKQEKYEELIDKYTEEKLKFWKEYKDLKDKITSLRDYHSFFQTKEWENNGLSWYAEDL